MNTTLLLSVPKPLLHLTKPRIHHSSPSLQITASKHPILQTLKNVAVSSVLFTTALSFNAKTGRAQQHTAPVPITTVTEIQDFEALKRALNSNQDEALNIVRHAIEEYPDEIEWRFLKARLLGQMGQPQNSRKVYEEEILRKDQFLIEALFENVLVMGHCGESKEVVTGVLRDVIQKAEANVDGKEVRLVMGMVKFVEGCYDDAFECFREVSEEDPCDWRSYFCQGMAFGVLGRDGEAAEMFAKYWELLPRNTEVEGLLKFPLKAQN